MNLRIILQSLRLLLGMSEQVIDLIADSKIPKEEQPLLHDEINLALGRLNTAKAKIEIDPPGKAK